MKPIMWKNPDRSVEVLYKEIQNIANSFLCFDFRLHSEEEFRRILNIPNIYIGGYEYDEWNDDWVFHYVFDGEIIITIAKSKAVYDIHEKDR